MSDFVESSAWMIVGKPGYGKTMIATIIASLYQRIWTTVSISRHGRQISNRIDSIDQLHCIPRDVHSVFLFDEAGLTNNAREGFSEANKAGVKLAALRRKVDMDVITISQLDRMQDVVWREMAEATIEMRKPKRDRRGRILFEYDTYRWDTFCGTHQAYMVEVLEALGLSYDTFDRSELWSRLDTEDVDEDLPDAPSDSLPGVF